MMENVEVTYGTFRKWSDPLAMSVYGVRAEVGFRRSQVR
jgi:hypothetical protein